MRGVHDQSCEAAPVRLTRLDTAFLCLDRDASPMHLGALVTFNRDWLVARGGSVDGLILRAFIPVSQRAGRAAY